MASAAQTSWKPHYSLTQAPTNLKEAIDWVLRVTGRDGKSNKAAASPPKFACLCYLAKAIKDLLYDAKDPGSPGPSSERYWENILLDQESDIVKPVLTDLGLLSGGSTSAASSTYTCAGGTEVIRTLIDHLAQGLQKWVGWQDEEECCLKGADGIGKKCDCPGGVSGCCSSGSTTPCHQCSQCGTTSAKSKCYLSSYRKKTASSGASSTTELFLWTTLSDKPDQVHLLARIFLGSVCLIWSGLSQLGWLTKGGSGGTERWNEGKLRKVFP